METIEFAGGKKENIIPTEQATASLQPLDPRVFWGKHLYAVVKLFSVLSKDFFSTDLSEQ